MFSVEDMIIRVMSWLFILIEYIFVAVMNCNTVPPLFFIPFSLYAS